MKTKRVFLLSGALLASMGGAALITWSIMTAIGSEPQSLANLQEVAAKQAVSTDDKVPNKKTAVRAVQSDTREDVESEQLMLASSGKFHVGGVFKEMRKVDTDTKGNVAINYRSMQALDRTIGRLPDDLTAENVAELQSIVQSAMPGKVGEQVATIVADYYEYVKAKRDFADLQPRSMDMDEQLQYYEELIALQNIALGEATAEKLFRKANNDAIYMMKSIQLTTNTTLSDEIKQSKLKELQKQYYQTEPPIAEWEVRADFFEERKQEVAAMWSDSVERRKQLRVLLATQFSEEEISIMDDYGIDLAYAD